MGSVLLFASTVLIENREYTCELEFCITILCVCVCEHSAPSSLKTWHVHKRVYLVREEQ